MAGQKFRDQITEIRFCHSCAIEVLNQWRGWPIKNKIPIPPIMEGIVCPVCNGAANLISTCVAWLNIHGPYNTGLPDYWVLSIGEEKEFVKEFPSKWGLPYFALSKCTKCKGDAIDSLFIPPLGWQIRRQCAKCGLTSIEEGK